MKNLKNTPLILVAFFTLMQSVVLFSATPVYGEERQNSYPLIFVHGFVGWGPDEMLGFKYWGGFTDIIGDLNNQGVEAYPAVVGPFSSNWDRAVELYYYIKGGTVDYGAAHAQEVNHERYGKTYPGIYPQWDGINKIHLVGHSMGGLTSRQLANFLENGSAEERAYHEAHPEEEISELFLGGVNSIHSITTIATPNNGTSFAENDNNLIGLAEDMLIGFASTAGALECNNVYDFKWDHFGLKKQLNEPLSDYLDRVLSSSIWESKDVALYDLSVQGIQENRDYLQTRSDIYYFSHTGQDTKKVAFSTRHSPIIRSMNPLLYFPAGYMGIYTNLYSNPVIDEKWAANDGLVNVVSSSYPFGAAAKPYDGKPNKGEWSYYPVMQMWDHLDYVGMSIITKKDWEKVNQYYLDIANTLYALPS